VRRQADDRRVAEQAADGRWRQVLLSDVNAVGLREPGDVAAIVDDQTCLVTTGQLHKGRRGRKECVAGHRLGAQLKKARAAA
jgi:hypothetical protein